MAIERVIDNVSHQDDTEEQVIEVSLRPGVCRARTPQAQP